MVVEVLEEKLNLKKTDLLRILSLIKEREALREKGIFLKLRESLWLFKETCLNINSSNMVSLILLIIDKKERYLETKVADLQKQIREEEWKIAKIICKNLIGINLIEG